MGEEPGSGLYRPSQACATQVPSLTGRTTNVKRGCRRLDHVPSQVPEYVVYTLGKASTLEHMLPFRLPTKVLYGDLVGLPTLLHSMAR